MYRNDLRKVGLHESKCLARWGYLCHNCSKAISAELVISQILFLENNYIVLITHLCDNVAGEKNVPNQAKWQ